MEDNLFEEDDIIAVREKRLKVAETKEDSRESVKEDARESVKEDARESVEEDKLDICIEALTNIIGLLKVIREDQKK